MGPPRSAGDTAILPGQVTARQVLWGDSAPPEEEKGGHYSQGVR